MSKKRRGGNNRIVTVWNGMKYLSMTHAALDLGITKQAMKQRIDKGYTCDDDLKPSRHTKPKEDESLSLDDIIVIIRYLRSPNATMTIQDIAKRYNVSEKRIRALL